MKKTAKIRRIATFVLALTPMFTLFSQHELPIRTMVAPAVVGVPPNIDGNDDDVCWSAASAITEVYIRSGWTGASDLSGYIKLCWDNYYLYVFANIVDDVAQNFTGSGNVYQYDNVLIALDADTSNSGLYSSDATYYRFNRGVLYQTGLPPRNEDIVDFAQTSSSTGWKVEVAIPWLSFLPDEISPDEVWSLINKNAVGFDVVFSDADGNLRDAAAAWDADVAGSGTTEDNVWNNTQQTGAISLSGTPFVNLRPIAVGDSDQTVYENTSVNLDASGSYDPEGHAITYLWSSQCGLTISNPTSSTTSFTAPDVPNDADITVDLTVNDSVYNSYVDHVIVRVININKTPLANAGSDKVTDERSMLLLDGSGSYDSDQQNLTYYWTSVDGALIINPTQVQSAFYAPEVSQTTKFRFALTVNDGLVNSSADTVNVTVTNLSVQKDTIYVFDTVHNFITIHDTIVHYDSIFVFDTTRIFNTIMITVLDISGKVEAKEVDGNLHVKLFPNPADVFIKINSEYTLNSIEIINTIGTSVYNESINSDDAEIDISGFDSGVYVIKMNTQYGILTKTLVIE
jgi:hypothetical protein